MGMLLASELPISYVTIAVIVILLAGLFRGIKKGLIAILLDIVSTVGSVVAAIFGGPYLANFLSTQKFVEGIGELAPAIISIASFVIVFILAILVFKLLGRIFRKLNDIPVVGFVNKILGAVFSIALSGLFIIIICYVINNFAQLITPLNGIIENAQIDPIGRYLFDNNLLDRILDFLSEKIPAIAIYVDTVRGLFNK